MANRRSEDLKIGDDIVVTSQALGYDKAEDILPEVSQIVARTFDRVRETLGENGLLILTNLEAVKTEADILTLLGLLSPAMVTISGQLGNGVLKRLVPLILAGTTVVLPDETGAKKRLELVKLSDRAEMFDAHPETYWRIVFFAGRVTFARFFPVRGRNAQAARTA